MKPLNSRVVANSEEMLVLCDSMSGAAARHDGSTPNTSPSQSPNGVRGNNSFAVAKFYEIWNYTGGDSRIGRKYIPTGQIRVFSNDGSQTGNHNFGG